MTKTTFIDLDAVVSNPVTISFQGVDHKLKPVTVEDFVANMKEIQELGTAPGFDKELDLTLRMLSRAFPSITKESFGSMSIEQMQRLVSTIHEMNGQEAGMKSAEEAAAKNPPQAA